MTSTHHHVDTCDRVPAAHENRCVESLRMEGPPIAISGRQILLKTATTP